MSKESLLENKYLIYITELICVMLLPVLEVNGQIIEVLKWEITPYMHYYAEKNHIVELTFCIHIETYVPRIGDGITLVLFYCRMWEWALLDWLQLPTQTVCYQYSHLPPRCSLPTCFRYGLLPRWRTELLVHPRGWGAHPLGQWHRCRVSVY